MTEEKEEVQVLRNRKQLKDLGKEIKVPLDMFEKIRMKPWVKDQKVGRNDPCPCGEGTSIEDDFGIIQNIPNKYKNCCMKKGKFNNYKTN